MSLKALSLVGERGGSSRVGLLIAVALLLRSTGSRAPGLYGARAPGRTGSRCTGSSSCSAFGLGHRLSDCGTHRLSCSEACGILLEQESNLCLPLWQVASLLLSHQGSPVTGYLNRSYVEGQAPETGNGKPLQCSSLENSTDR